MHKTVLILGASGRFGRNAAHSFEEAGWEVRAFDRETDSLWDAAWGASVIVNAWNPSYEKWANVVPSLTESVIEVAQTTGATVVIPGNVYVYGDQSPELMSSDTPHDAKNPLGLIRRDMEERYHASGVKTLVLRAGDFIDTEASGNWFDKIITAEIDRNVIRAPGDPYAFHSWAYLPDLTRALVDLLDRKTATPQFEEVLFPGYTSSLLELTRALEDVFRRQFDLKPFAWWQVQLAKPVWPLAKHLLEMRYLWSKPHRIDGKGFAEALPRFRHTPLRQALADSFEEKIHPDQPMPRSRVCRKVGGSKGYA